MGLHVLDSISIHHHFTSFYASLYHGSTSPYFNLILSTIALLPSTWLYIILPRLDPTSLWNGSTSLYVNLRSSTMVLLDSTWVYFTVPWLYFTLLDSTSPYHGSTSLYFNLHDSPMALIPSTSHYSLIDLLVFTVCLLHSISLYTSLYWGSISLNLTLLFLQLLYFPLLDSALFYFAST